MSPRYCWLTTSGCIEVGGADATDFLNAQLSQAMDRVAEGVAPLTAWHDPRGRVRALFRAFRLADRWRLLASADIVEQTTTRLGMFVLRAKVTLARPDDQLVVALLDPEPAWLADRMLPVSASRDASFALGDARIVHVGAGLWQAVGTRDALERLTADLDAADEPAATLAQIRLGVPSVPAAVTERYVAQMLNLDVLGAVAFDKGCYPGQEVIARVRNLGSVKRRMRRFATDARTLPAPGTELFDPQGSAVGEVLTAAPADNGTQMLAVVEHSAASGVISTGDGARWQAQPLPYDVPSR